MRINDYMKGSGGWFYSAPPGFKETGIKGSGGWLYSEQVWKALAEAGMKGSGTASIEKPSSSKYQGVEVLRMETIIM